MNASDKSPTEKVVEHAIDEMNRARRERDMALKLLEHLTQCSPSSADMRMLWIAAFSQTTNAYDALDELKRQARDLIDRTNAMRYTEGYPKEQWP